MLNLLQFIILFKWAKYLFNTYLNYRQIKILTRNHILPQDLVDVYTDESFEKCKKYNFDHIVFGSIKDLILHILDTIFLLNYMEYQVYQASKVIQSYTYSFDVGRDLVVATYYLAIQSILSTIISLPFSIYSNFVLEEKYKMNNYTLQFFLVDLLKKLVFEIILSSLIVCITIRIIEMLGPYLIIAGPTFFFVFQIFIILIYQDYIAPLFDKYIELPKGELRIKIEELANKLDFPLRDIRIVENSKRSSHSNAYFIGLFGKKTIVLFDTLLAESPFKSEKSNSNDNQTKNPSTDEEIVSVLSHELGHWNHCHLFWNLLIGQINYILMFYILGRYIHSTWIYQSFGFQNEFPTIIGLQIVSMYLMAPYFTFFSHISTFISRFFEFQADAFSHRFGYHLTLISALKKLNINNLSYPIKDWLMVALTHSHPDLLARIKYLRSLDKKQ